MADLIDPDMKASEFFTDAHKTKVGVYFGKNPDKLRPFVDSLKLDVAEFTKGGNAAAKDNGERALNAWLAANPNGTVAQFLHALIDAKARVCAANLDIGWAFDGQVAKKALGNAPWKIGSK
jgi:hypothetical protein